MLALCGLSACSADLDPASAQRLAALALVALMVLTPLAGVTDVAAMVLLAAGRRAVARGLSVAAIGINGVMWASTVRLLASGASVDGLLASAVGFCAVQVAVLLLCMWGPGTRGATDQGA